MKKISIWAKHHKWESRIIIVVMQILLGLIAWFLGTNAPEFTADATKTLIAIFSVLTVSIVLIYSHFKKNYVYRKTFDVLLITVSFGFVFMFSNQNFQLPGSFANAAEITNRDTTSFSKHPLITSFKEKLMNMDKSKLTKKEKRRIIKAQIRTIRHDNNLSNGEKVALVILTVLLGVALLFGVAALSCSISCSGSGALAALVAIFGVVGIIFLMVWLGGKIGNKYPRQRDKATTGR